MKTSKDVLKESIGELRYNLNGSVTNSQIELAIDEYAKELQQEIERLKQREKECDHPFSYVVSKCNGEINKCLKCGKDNI